MLTQDPSRIALDATLPGATPRATPVEDALRARFAHYLNETMLLEDSAESPSARLAWRLSRFDQGLELRALASDLGWTPEGSSVLDAGGGYGGNALPFAQAGAQTWVIDAGDNHFTPLNAFAQALGLPLAARVDSVLDLGFADESFDLVLSLDVIEHVPDPDALARELARVLKPGGLGLVTTPARWKFLSRDPHFGVPFLHAVPQVWREQVARKVFRRTYPWPVYRIYGAVAEVGRPFWRHGLTVQAATPWSPAARSVKQRLPEPVFQALEAHFWEILIVRKPF